MHLEEGERVAASPTIRTRANASATHHRPTRARWLPQAAGLLLLLVAAWLAWLWPLGLVKQPVFFRGESPQGEIYGDRLVRQTFVADSDNLCQIDVALATLGRVNDVGLDFTLLDQKAGSELAKAQVAGRKVVDKAYHAFAFPCIKESEGQSYAFVLRSLDGKPGRALSVWASRDDLYTGGKLDIGGQIASGDALFRLGYRNTIGDQVGVNVRAMTHRQPPWADGRLFGVLVGICVMAAAATLVLGYLAIGSTRDRA